MVLPRQESRVVWIERVSKEKHFCKCGCGGLIKIQSHHKKYGVPDYIHGHHSRGKYIKEVASNFWEKTDKKEVHVCWNWKAFIRPDGYGTIQSSLLKSKNFLAHRLSYLLHYGELPDGLLVLHKCDNRKCVNPNHLYLGTDADNERDMVIRDRMKGVVKVKIVKKIAKMIEQEISNKAIAKELGVSIKLVSRIKRGSNWSIITGIKKKV